MLVTHERSHYAQKPSIYAIFAAYCPDGRSYNATRHMVGISVHRLNGDSD